MTNQIEVTRMNRLDGQGPLLAFCDISLFETLIIKGFRVVNGKKSIFVGMPQKLGKDGKWYNTVKPMNKELHKAIEATVLEAYGG